MRSTVIQEEVIEEFALLAGDMELTLRYLMEHGGRLDPLAAADKVDQNLVQGCLSRVWMVVGVRDKCLQLQAASDAAITQGLVSLLVRCFHGEVLEAVVGAELFFPQRIGMQHFIGTQRSGGFAMMWQKIQQQARQLLKVYARNS